VQTPGEPTTAPSAEPSPAASEDAAEGDDPGILPPVLLVLALAAAGYFVWKSRVA
jgi:hypothetical protein